MDRATNADFFASGNWNQSWIPFDTDGNDAATFRLGNVADTVAFTQDATVDRLIVGSNTITFSPFIGDMLTVDNTSVSETGRGIVIGALASDVAMLNNNLPTFTTLYATLGSAAGSSGTLNVNTGTFSVTGTGANYDLIIGLNGAGTITANGGDVNVAGDTFVGLNAGSVGIVNVTNANSVWTNSDIPLAFPVAASCNDKSDKRLPKRNCIGDIGRRIDGCSCPLTD